MPNIILSSTGIAVGIDKPAGVGVIVAALEVVEPGLGVVVVTTVPERVDFCHSAGSGQDFAVGISYVVITEVQDLGDTATDNDLPYQYFSLYQPSIYVYYIISRII